MCTLRSCKRLVLAMTAACLLASPLFAGPLRGGITSLVVGADRFGSPSLRLGGRGNGKIFRDRRTGIIVLVAVAFVRNESKLSRSFVNLGTQVTDPTTGLTCRAKSDVTGLSKPLWGISAGSLVAVCAPQPVATPAP